MNERIQQLAEQAEQYVKSNTQAGVTIHAGDMFNKKFAELILQECLLKINGAKIRNESYAELIERIKEDFGVEE